MDTFLVITLVLLALLVGGVLGHVLTRRRADAEAERSRAELAGRGEELAEARRAHDAMAAEFEAWRRSTAEQQKTEEQRRQELEQSFAALARKALRIESDEFLKLATEKEEQRTRALEEKLKPFRESLEKIRQGTQELEAKREKAYGSLEKHLEMLKGATDALGNQSRTLVTALKGDARARGRWGEVTLRNIADMAGMMPHCDFSEQSTLADGSRPDMVVKLPGADGLIPVDAKVPMDAYMRAIEAEDPEVRKVELAKHAADVREHVLTLARRDYASGVEGRVDFTVMFVPNEPVLAAAFELNPALNEEAMAKRVLVATPVTLLALLRTVSLYWSQSDMAEHAREYWDVGREFHKRVVTFAQHLDSIGKGLETASSNYEKALRSYESRVLPQGRRLEELDSTGRADKALPDMNAVDASRKRLAVQERQAAEGDDGPS